MNHPSRPLPARPVLPWLDIHLAPPDHRLRACVIIPARNEAERIGSALHALVNQQGKGGASLEPAALEVIVFANNCTDQTAALARRIAREVAAPAIHVVEGTLPLEQAHVGTARRWLMDQACHRLEAVGQVRGLIGSTDADSEVARTWVSASLRELDLGADAVAGLVRVNRSELRQLDPAIRRAYLADLVYRRLTLELEAIIDPNPLDPQPGHDFHGGASLGITPELYRRVGGLPPLRSLEDVALTEACWRADARFVHSSRVRVRTSARAIGRARGGFSQVFARWAAAEPILVHNASAIEGELITRAQVRRWFATKRSNVRPGWQPDPADLAQLAHSVRLDEAEVLSILHASETFGQLLLNLKAGLADRLSNPPPLVPIAAAIGGLRDRVRSHSS